MKEIKQDIKKYDGVKSSVALFLATVVNTGISYIATPIYTRILTPEEYGQTSVFMTWLKILGIVAMFNLSAGVFNNGMLDYPDERDDYSLSMLALSNTITIVVFIAVLCLNNLNNWFRFEPLYIWLMFIIFLFQPAFKFWSAKQRYEYKYKANFIWSVFLAIISPTVAILLIKAFPEKRFFARIFGAEIPLLLIYMGFYAYIVIKGKHRIQTKFWKEAFLFNLPLIPHYLSSYILSSSDKIMISYLINDSAVAYYSVAHSIASVAIIIWEAINSSLIPYTYSKCKEKEYGGLSSIVNAIVLAYAIICAGIIALAPEIMSVMGTNGYESAIYVIPPIISGVFFQVQYYLFANILYYYKRPKFVMFASITAAILNVILNYLFIPKYGYIAAGYTTIACYALQAVLNYVSMKKVVKEKIYDTRFIFTISVFLIVYSLLILFVYHIRTIRYIIIFALLVFLWLKRKVIIQTISYIKR